MNKLSLVWQNISVKISEENAKEKKTVLDCVSGYASSGTLIAIMGTSGCGKTTLLGAVSGRVKDKSGTIKLNDTIVSEKLLQNLSGYVHQQDIFTESLTVLEHLNFMASLQHIQDDKFDKNQNNSVQNVLNDLSLDSQCNTTIKYLSGGEKRRLSLASELLKNAPILFCDEPTTGLDSFAAILIMQKLQTIALSGKIVLTTIHQPSSQLFDHFHDIILMSAGQIVFQGTTNEAQLFFQSLNLHCPESFNPADFYIKCLFNADAKMLRDHHFERSKWHLNDKIKQKTIIENAFPLKPVKYSCLTALKWLLWRNFVNIKRDYLVQLTSYIFLIIIALTVASTYAFVKLTDEDSIQDIKGVLISLVSELAFTNMYAVIYIFPEEQVIFLREKHLYSTSVYFLSKLLSTIPICLLTTFGYTTITYFPMRFFNGYVLWLKMSFYLFIMSITSCSLGLALSANCPQIEHVQVLVGSLECLLVLLSGFWIKLETVSVLFRWMAYVSPFYYGFETLAYMFWSNVTYIGNCRPGSDLPCFENGTQVLESYGLNTGPNVIYYNIAAMNALTVLFAFIGWIGLFRRSFASVY